ncbi:HNH endonuclease [Chryseobacterium sp. T16E-39]|uniref:HNH endonuclease n=1 Tax=Chryseobacterium sp. T16E-39 TaxID=2015076 RepID=UPI000B5B407A|nr:HNH endonuclease signature motif containing protein [Chryseobacterium sp. T16E-39]ASK29689.1 HNH endonuclease [Chryseobacterium sp. T16E-39]
MQKHTKNYLQFFKPHDEQNIPCEVCANRAVDIHHIIPRSKFGKKRKEEQDHVENLIALCRVCHDMAHDEKFSKDYLSKIHFKKIKSINTL